MRIKLLGASAGGGFPQWNCSCGNCRSFRQGSFKGRSRTQSQVAVSPDGKSWFLLNASPDLRTQIEGTRELHSQAKGSDTRHTPISGVILTNADLDHVLGLLLMRESQPLHVYATVSVKKILSEDNSMFKMIDQKQGQVKWSEITPGVPFELRSVDGSPSGLKCTPHSISTKYPIYVSKSRLAELSPGDAVMALVIEDAGSSKKMAYLPGTATLDQLWLDRLGSCDLVFCDGTFWTDDELKKISGADRTAREMGHIPMSGPDGSVALLSKLKKPIKVYTHINNTNPVLNEAGSEYQEVVSHGIQLGYDGMEFTL
jgi:pyrroloquinoline quinone biosynthesis protein B